MAAEITLKEESALEFKNSGKILADSEYMLNDSGIFELDESF